MTSCRWYKSAQSVVDAACALKWTVEHFGRTPCVSILCRDALTMGDAMMESTATTALHILVSLEFYSLLPVTSHKGKHTHFE